MAENPGRREIPFLHSIQVKTWAGIFLVSIVPLAVLGYFSIGFLSQISKDLLIKSNLQAFQQVKGEVEHYVQMYEDLLRLLKTDARLSDPGATIAGEALRQMDQAYEFIDRIVLCASDGTILAHSGKDPGEAPPLSPEERRVHAGQETLSFGQGSFFLKLQDGEKAAGPALIASVSFLKLRKTLEGMAFGTSFRFYLVTRDGESVLGEKDFPRALIQHLVKLPFGGYDLLSEGEGSPDRVAIILPILQHGLRIIVIQDALEVYGIVQRMKRNIHLVIGLVGIIAFAAGTLFSLRLTNPIITIADKVNEISGGNLRVNVQSTRKDEIGFLASCFNTMTVRIRKKVFELTTLFKISQIINNSNSYQKALDDTLSYLVHTFLATRGSIMLLADNEDQLKLKSARTFGEVQGAAPTALQELITMRLGEGIAGRVLESGQPILCLDCSLDDRFKPYDPGVEMPSPKVLFCAPLIIQGKPLGVINLVDRTDPESFSEDDLGLLMAIAGQLAVSIDNARLHELAITDGLTGLFIHRYFQLRLDDEIKRARRHETPLALILFDIDHFKVFNDTYGHQQGDRVLREVARMVKDSARAEDIACRYGGEEFAVILPHTRADQALILAERLRQRVEQAVLPHGEVSLHVTISIGISEFPVMATDKGPLIRKADQALYHCKAKGRNCVFIFDDAMA